MGLDLTAALRRLLLWLETALYGSAAAVAGLSVERHATDDDPLASPIEPLAPAETEAPTPDPWVERKLSLLATTAVPPGTLPR